MFAVKENQFGVVEWLLSSCDPSDACEQLCVPQNRVCLLVVVWWFKLF